MEYFPAADLKLQNNNYKGYCDDFNEFNPIIHPDSSVNDISLYLKLITKLFESISVIPIIPRNEVDDNIVKIKFEIKELSIILIIYDITEENIKTAIKHMQKNRYGTCNIFG